MLIIFLWYNQFKRKEIIKNETKCCYVWTRDTTKYLKYCKNLCSNRRKITFNKACLLYTSTVKSQLEEIATIREEGRYQEILTEANEEIAENEKKLEDIK